MGRSYSTFDYQQQQRNLEIAAKRAETIKRMKLAEKLVMVMVDRINQVVVRPGPDPEERECYDMAQEIRDLSPELAELLGKVLKVHEEES